MSYVEEGAQVDVLADAAPLLSSEGVEAPAPQRSTRRVVVWTVAMMVMASFVVVAWAAGSSGSSSMMTTYSRAFTGLAEESAAAADTLTLPVTLRDFDGNVGEYTLFGEGCSPSTEGIVDSTLPEAGLPKFIKKGSLIDSQTELDALFTTMEGVNKEYHQTLEFKKDASGLYVADYPGYFPLDDYKPPSQHDVDPEKDIHNYYFSLELRTRFTYNGGEKFTFRGDDDVFVFIDKKLVVDIGGCHSPRYKEVDIDSLGLTKGTDYPLDFFFAERQCCGSNLRITTTLQLVEPDSDEDGYKCCFFHFVGLPWICFDSKKFPWCSATEEE